VAITYACNSGIISNHNSKKQVISTFLSNMTSFENKNRSISASVDWAERNYVLLINKQHVLHILFIPYRTSYYQMISSIEALTRLDMGIGSWLL
jgi:hypothetical protein